MQSFPKRIEIELSNVCNLSCSYCPRRFLKDKGGFIDYNLFKRLIDEISEYPDSIIVLHRRGESLLHPRFVDVLRYVKGKFREVQIATNATVMDAQKAQTMAECLDFVSFSLDTPERCSKIRGADYKTVLDNIEYFLQRNTKAKTQVSMVRTDDVIESDIKTFKDLWKGKVDRIRIYEEHSKDGKFGSLNRKRNGRKCCKMPFYQILIYYDGTTGRCNHDWEGDLMGDLNTNTISQIWNNSKYVDLRRQHENNMITDETCKNCDSWYPEIGNQGTGEVIE